MKKQILLIQFIGLVLILSASTLFAQTNPAAHVLAAKSFEFNKSANGTKFAASMAGWSGGQVLEQPTAPTTVQADGDEPICASCSPTASGSSLINQGDLGINIGRKADNIPGRPLAIVIARTSPFPGQQQLPIKTMFHTVHCNYNIGLVQQEIGPMFLAKFMKPLKNYLLLLAQPFYLLKLRDKIMFS